MTCALVTEKGSALLTGAAVVVSCPVVAAGLPGRTGEERTLAALWNLLPAELLGSGEGKVVGQFCFVNINDRLLRALLCLQPLQGTL